jgi:hypothetical protein
MGRPLAPPHLSPFPEVVLGLALASWVGFLLAEGGVFSLTGLLAVLAVYSAALMVGARGLGQASLSGPGTLLTPSLAVAVVVGLVAVLLYSPPYETIVNASDATVYFNTGVHIARSGSISVVDPLVAELGFNERLALFPRGRTEGWTRLPGTVMVASGSTEVVWPSYSHLVPVWIAIFYASGGLEAAGLVVITFGALALWAVALFAAETRGWLAASVATALLLSNDGQFFFARFLMPEIVCQFFLWAGLLAFVVWWREAWPAAGAIAALTFGITGLARVEYLFFVPLALALYLGFAARYPRGVWLFVALYAAITVHGLAHMMLVPTHYRDVVTRQLAALWSQVGAIGAGRAAMVLAVVALLAVALVRTRGGWWGYMRRGAALTAAGTWVAAFAYASWRRVLPNALETLGDAVPWPVLAVGAVGLVPWVVRAVRAERGLFLPLLLVLLVTGAFLYDPHVTPIYPWALRRFVPATVPLVCVLAGTALAWLTGWMTSRRAVVVTVLAGLLLVSFNARPLTRLYPLPIYPEQKHQVRALAEQLPAGAVVFFAPDLGNTMLYLPLWLVHDRETFVLPGWRWQHGLQQAAFALVGRHPVFYVDAADDPEPSVGGLTFLRRGGLELAFVVPDFGRNVSPSGATGWRVPIRVYQVTAEGGASGPMSGNRVAG